MSYILDALRKSDQLRQRGAAPTLLLAQATTAAPKQPVLLAYGLLALVLLGVGIAIGWLRPWQPEPAAPAPTIAAKPPGSGQSQLPAVGPDLAPKPVSEMHVQNSASATQAVPAPAPALALAHGSAGVKTRRQGAPPKAVAEASEKAAAPMPDQALSTSSAITGAVPVPTVVAMAELPVVIQQELPPMSISVHAYSDKGAERLVGINSRLLHEGEYVAPGLRLEQITPDGMIFSYKGYSFRRRVH